MTTPKLLAMAEQAKTSKAPARRSLSFGEAKARYVHRFTMQHVPAWARDMRSAGTYCAPQYRTDAEWYAATLFPGESPLCPPRSKHCYSSGQTWPLGQSLAKPYAP